MEPAIRTLREFGVEVHARVVSAHRTPEMMVEFGRTAIEAGYSVIIAAAGGAAHLPGMLASLTRLPVIGVPVPITALGGIDALLSIVQMPAGVPVATMAIGGATNAALMAIRILAVTDPALADRLEAHRAALATKSLAGDSEVTSCTQPHDPCRAHHQRGSDLATSIHPDAASALGTTDTDLDTIERDSAHGDLLPIAVRLPAGDDSPSTTGTSDNAAPPSTTSPASGRKRAGPMPSGRSV